ncbi:Oligopeptide transport ATP-binding protein OppF [Pseudoruegeria aquimaris]|uniref:Oligopeptide transport ATP-binding protein OppF n=1 Tax=Pseudoruegeria aquimaris TaxID=393663 RepID=A0A1Y5SRE3_9RHOB|nr:oligopeptide/dipeptide ABC transporter ATP-binding protein [Pseudoruegeria aquimaris]SLN43497.1 Oligopeptide transport ATP-binding protein OppF [Pseudoruegeria aquimaris]
MSEPILTVEDLKVTFDTRQGRKWPWSPMKKVHAVNGVSLSLERGRTLGVVGESGCGKSTLIRAIAGLVTPTGGTVTLEGRAVDYGSRADVLALRHKVQMIFQDPVASLNPRMTVREIVSEPTRRFRGDLDPEAQDKLVHDLLDRVGIAQRNFNRYPHEFSGGQCQRIGIARALAVNPKILLCDEPVSALDVSIQAQVVNLLRELQAEMGLSLIFVAHDLGVVRHISDDILVMYMGGMMEKGESDALVRTPRHPYTQALLSSVPVPDPNVIVEPQVLEGDLPSPLNLPEGCLFQSRCPKRQDACKATKPALLAAGGREVACHFAE